MDSDTRLNARTLAARAIAHGEPTAWFEQLYAGAADASAISWADLEANPSMVEWLRREAISGSGRRALVVGCGLGDDAEALARHGFEVVAFDISPTAISWAMRRFPDSDVRYVVADALALPVEWRGGFDLVLEANTLQVLPAKLRPVVAAQISACLRPGGALLAIARGREPDEPEGRMPWPLTRDELSSLFGIELHEERMEDYLDGEKPAVRRLRASFRARIRLGDQPGGR